MFFIFFNADPTEGFLDFFHQNFHELVMSTDDERRTHAFDLVYPNTVFKIK